MTNSDIELSLNNWIFQEDKNFGYNLFWPYAEKINPREDSIDVYVVLNKDKEKQYIGTFITVRKIRSLLRKFKKTGEFAGGSYVHFPKEEMIVRTINHESIERTLENLIKEGMLEELFIVSTANIPYD